MKKKVTSTMGTHSHKIQVVLEQNREIIRVKEAPKQEKVQSSNPTIKEKYNNIVHELDRLVGLDVVKKLIFEIFAFVQIDQQRTSVGLRSNSQVYHMVFKGNPGTGKTTVARIMAKMFKEMGILTKGHLIEVERADLVGEYIGHTAQKTREHVKKALGGILFIDEAYSLTRGGEKDFGREAIDTLVKEMEDHKNDFLLILAGYSFEMENFIRTNPGLHSRFPLQLHFDDYTLDELLEIAEVMVAEREYLLSPMSKQKLKAYILEEKNNPIRSFSNARLVRNWVEKAIRNHAVRLINEGEISNSRLALMTLQPEDLLEIKMKYF